MVREIDHPLIGRMKILGNPVKASSDLTRSRAPAPWLGQHTAGILEQLGYSEDQIGALFADGVAYDQQRKAVPSD